MHIRTQHEGISQADYRKQLDKKRKCGNTIRISHGLTNPEIP
jgi:hypothetical protein